MPALTSDEIAAALSAASTAAVELLRDLATVSSSAALVAGPAWEWTASTARCAREPQQEWHTPTEGLVGDLAAAGLLVPLEPASAGCRMPDEIRYRMPDEIRHRALELGPRDQALGRAIAGGARLLAAALRAVSPWPLRFSPVLGGNVVTANTLTFDGPGQAWAWLRRERPLLLRLFVAAAAGKDPLTITYAEAWDVWRAASDSALLESTQRAALALISTERAEVGAVPEWWDRVEPVLETRLAHALSDQGRHAEAIMRCTKAASRARTLADRWPGPAQWAEATAYGTLARAQSIAGNHCGALAAIEQARRADSANIRRAALLSRRAVHIYLDLGDITTALHECVVAKARFATVGDTRLAGKMLTLTSQIHREHGDPHAAMTAAHEAVATLQQLGSTPELNEAHEAAALAHQACRGPDAVDPAAASTADVSSTAAVDGLAAATAAMLASTTTDTAR